MGRKRTAALYERNGVWHIDKQIRGVRLCESNGESSLAKADEYFAKKAEEVRQDLLGHKSGRITTHYSAANRVCGENSRKSPALVFLKQKAATA
jgi:hypothetical protein